MTEHEKIDRSVAELVEVGVWRVFAAPLPYQILWKLGVPVPPPHFQSFRSLFSLWSFCFGAMVASVYGLFLSFSGANRRDPVMLVFVASTVGLLLGSLAGWLAAIYYRRASRRLGLPTWKQYTPGETPDEPNW